MIPRDYEEPVSFWEWVRCLLVTMIPGIGLVMMIYWAFSSHTKTSKRNLFRAQLFFFVPLTLLLAVVFSFAAIPAFQKVREASIAKAEANARKQAAAEAPVAPETTSSAAPAATPPPALPASPTAPTAEAAADSAFGASPASAAATAEKPRPTLTPDEPTRSLRSSDGRVIEARVISLTDDDVTIVRVNGQEFTIPMSRFAPEEVAYFMRLRHGRDAFD